MARGARGGRGCTRARGFGALKLNGVERPVSTACRQLSARGSTERCLVATEVGRRVSVRDGRVVVLAREREGKSSAACGLMRGSDVLRFFVVTVVSRKAQYRVSVRIHRMSTATADGWSETIADAPELPYAPLAADPLQSRSG